MNIAADIVNDMNEVLGASNENADPNPILLVDLETEELEVGAVPHGLHHDL